MISTGLPYLQFSMNCQGFSPARLTWPGQHTTTVGNVKIAQPENIALLLHPHVWSLRNLTFEGKLCLRDDKNAAFV